jgi:5'-methylthioadenosine phosphorylase
MLSFCHSKQEEAMSENPKIGIIGGSGLYAMAGLSDIEEHKISTPFGDPSAPIVVGTLEGKQIAFLARHGIGHTINPTQVNYRANIYALKALGVKWIISVSACGSLREDYAPGHIVVPDQLYDFTKKRDYTFFDAAPVVHVGVADPFCKKLSEQLYQAIQATGAPAHRGGTTITIEGPRFSTKGESEIYRGWGLSLINMTTSPEAFLAREAECCYAVMNHVTDYDVWHEAEEEVSVEQVIKILMKNTGVAQEAIRKLAADFNTEDECEHHSALASALITDPTQIPPEQLERLSLLVGRYYQ